MARLIAIHLAYAALLAAALLVVITVTVPDAVFGLTPNADPAAVDRVIDRQMRFAAIAAVCTAIGIASKLVFDAINAGAPVARLLGWRKLVGAMLVAPVVLGATVEPLLKIDNTLLALIFCYQNGFFFQAVLGRGGQTAA